MSDVQHVATALADPTRRRVVATLSAAPARTKHLAELTSTSASALSRHLNVLRAAGIVERADVAADGRGREYRLVSGSLDDFGDWVDTTRWADTLAARSSGPLAERLLGRVGAFLDGFTVGDRAFFERHLADDVQLVFPGTTAAIDKIECLATIGAHPVWRRYDIEPGAVGRDLGRHSLLTATALIEHDDDPRPRRVFISVVFCESRPWQLVHLQWTTASDPTGASDDGT